jgi:hypothetical protein
MRFPWIGVGSALLAAFGGYGLYWYHNLSKAEQAEADELAVDYARQLFDKGLDELTSHQLERVHDLVKRRFAA